MTPKARIKELEDMVRQLTEKVGLEKRDKGKWHQEYVEANEQRVVAENELENLKGKRRLEDEAHGEELTQLKEQHKTELTAAMAGGSPALGEIKADLSAIKNCLLTVLGGTVRGGTDQPWYCPTCVKGVPGDQVTYEETHDVRAGGCGQPVVSTQVGVPATEKQAPKFCAEDCGNPVDSECVNGRCLECCGMTCACYLKASAGGEGKED